MLRRSLVCIVIICSILFVFPLDLMSLTPSKPSHLSLDICIEFNEILASVDNSIRRGEYYKALNLIESALTGKIKNETKLRLEIRKSIVLINLSKDKQAKEILLSVDDVLRKKKFRKSEAQFELLYAKGKLEFYQGDYLTSEGTFLRAINLDCNYQKEENAFYCDAVSDLGKTYLLLGKFESCDTLLTTIISSFDLRSLDKAKIETNLTYSYYEQGRFEEADSVVHICKEHISKVIGSNNLVYAAALEMESSIYENLGKVDQADSLNQIVYAIRKDYYKDDHISFAASLNSMASVLWIKGDNEKAVELYLEAIQISKKLQGELHPEYITLVNNLAVSYVMLAQYKKGLNLFISIRKTILETLGDENPEYGTNLNNLAFTYFKLGKYRKTKEMYAEALLFREKTIGIKHPDYLSTLNNLGILQDRLGELNLAEETFLKGKKLVAENLGVDHPHYAKFLNNLGGLYLSTGDYIECEKIYIESLGYYEKLNGKNHSTYATVKSNLGHLYRLTNQLDKSRETFQETVQIFKEVIGDKHEKYARALSTLGLIEMDFGNLDVAEKYLYEACQIDKEVLGTEHTDYASSLANLASVNWEKEKIELAEKYFLEAIAIEERNLSPTSEIYMTTLKNVIKFYSDTNNIDSSFVYSYKLLDSQIQLMEIGLDFMSEAQKTRIKKNKIGEFSYAKRLALKTNDQKFIKKIYNLCLYEKGLLLNSSLSTKEYVLAQNNAKVLDQFVELKDLKNQLLKDIQGNNPNETVVEEIANIEKDLAKASSYFRNQQLQNKVDVDQIRLALRPKEVAVEFMYFAEKNKTTYAALILNPVDNNIKVVKLFERDELVFTNKLSKSNYVNALYSNSDKSITIRKNEVTPLYKLIWEPLMPHLKDVKKIYYSGAGVLQRLNLDAIPLNSDLAMGAKFNMENLMSTRNIIKSGGENENNNSSYIVGGVNYDISSTQNATDDWEFNSDVVGVDRSSKSYWEYLPFSKKECVNIESTLQDNDITVTFLNDGFATESNFKELGTKGKSPHIIHLATHGFFFSDPSKSVLVDSSVLYKVAKDPMLRSGLILAGANGSWKGDNEINAQDDGILTAYEVANMNLTNTELVVLSACETGMGEITGSEGVYGLQRAFKKAGAKYLIMSLWKIPDEETSNFMSYFYNAWQNDKLSIRDAFNKTQIQMHKKYDDPYKWAGFVLIE